MGVLAIHGGERAADAAHIKWPVFKQNDANGLLNVLSQPVQGKFGPSSQRFEERFAAYNGVKHCIVCANGTVSIELILRALGLGRGDEIIIPPYTFIATISSIIYAGLTPVFADIEPDTFCLSARSVAEKLTPKTRAIMPVYVGGRPADLDALLDVAQSHGIPLIGDAAQAVGSQWRGRGIGSWGIAASFSCQNSKNLTSGEGGIITTDDDALAETIRTMLRGGLSADGQYTHIGLNHSMSEFQASILYSQMDRLDGQIEKRMENAAYLDELLRPLPYVSPAVADGRITKNSLHLYLLRIHEDRLDGVSRADFLKALQAEGVGFTDGYRPLYEFPCLFSRYTRRAAGAAISRDPGTPNAERIAGHEGAWLGQTALLQDKSVMKLIAEAIEKVYDNRRELL